MRFQLFFSTVAVYLCACTGSHLHPAAPPPADLLPTLTTPQGRVGCQKMMDDYCSFLYSPDALGNVEVNRSSEKFTVLQGDTNNDFSQVYFRYAKAKLTHRDKLPADFLAALKPSDYFGILKRSLNRKTRKLMSLEDRLEAERSDYQLESLWSSALNETLWQRLSKKYPGVYQLSERQMPPEYDLELKKLRRVLISEISKALWHDDSNWHKVEETFAQLQKIYVDLIDRMDLSPDVADAWRTRIKAVKLALPGSMPEISDDECSATTINAYYYQRLDVITVCAGDFNSEDILLTLSHEMGHALDISRSLYLHEIKSSLGQNESELRSRVCTGEPTFSCDHWDHFKAAFDERLQAMGSYRYDVLEFNRCLKRKPTHRVPSVEDLTRIAHSVTINRYASLATNGYFLRITKKKIPLRNGRMNPNPYYLDPCRYYLYSQGEEPPDEELTSLVYFTAEYRCSDPDDPDRFRKSIDLSKNMTEKLVHKVLELEGEFSSYDMMEREGFSSPPMERFADVIGTAAMAEFLKASPHIEDRRAKFLASSSWQCSEPSLMSHYPDESKIENEYAFTHHSDGLDRRREILSLPIREVLTCEKDFEFQECALPMKKEVLP